MLRLVAAGATALFLTASPLAYAQDKLTERLSAADWGAITDARVNIIKTALQLTPDQEKLWPPIEDAIRARAKDREARLKSAAERAAEVRDKGVAEALKNRDPVAFLRRRSEALAQRSADLKKLADAWQPLYATLSPEQKKRMGLLTLIVLRELKSAVEERRAQSGDDDDED
jgi:hypothetical protein